MNKNIKYSFWEYISDIWHYIIPYKGQFLLGIFLRFTSDMSNLYPALAVSKIVLILSKPIDPVSTPKELLPVFILWAITATYYGLSHNLSKYFGFQVAEKASLDIYRETLAHIFKLDLSWQEKENSGNKMKRIDRGLDGVNLTIRRIFDTIIEVTVNFGGIIAIFVVIDTGLSIALILFILIYLGIGTYLLKRAIKQERIVNKAFENLGGLTFESLNNVQTIKSLAIDGGVVRLIGRLTNNLIEKIRKRIFYYQSQQGILLTYQIVFGFLAMLFISRGIILGNYQLNLLVLFMGLYSKVRTSSDELTQVVQQISQAKVWMSRSMAILTTKPVIENPEIVKKQKEYPANWKEMKINNLKFSYKNSITLDNVSFSIKRGEKVGIVGLSGAGKSTLFKLMLDLYENYNGNIFIDDIPLKKIKRQSYINHVGVVLQDTELFDMSLRENIEIAGVNKKTNSDKLFKEVISMAHLGDVVGMLPKGPDTIVGEKGVKLSGGQRQRVGIARALYREPDILLLDEATSHLDAHSEKEIQKALEEFLHKYTTIVIAHRLSTILAMDKIVVLEKGKVVETGNFKELVDKNGVFAKMWEEQKI